MNSRPRVLVVLNPSAHGGGGARRFERVRSLVESSFDASTVVGGPDGVWETEVRAALERGVRISIAAVVDGTAHRLVNSLICAPHRPRLEALTLGAVGLGSSNDLHKPVRQRVGGVPVLLDVARAAPRDVVRCSYLNGDRRVAYVLVSASMGITASANACFSRDKPMARFLRRLSTSAAIAWAATRTLATWHNLPALLRIDDGAPTPIALSSVSVLKTEWLSGRLRYGGPIQPASGDFDVALAEGLGRVRLLADLLALLRGKFDGRRGHRRLHARSLAVRFDRAVPLELDGEIVAGREVCFDMFAERIRLCA